MPADQYNGPVDVHSPLHQEATLSLHHHQYMHYNRGEGDRLTFSAGGAL